MLFIMLGVGFAGYFILLPLKVYLSKLKLLRSDELKSHQYKVFSGATWMIAAQSTLVVASIVLVVVTGIPSFVETGDGTWIGIGLSLMGSAIGSIISALNNRRLFYNDKGFLLNDRHVHYKSIKNFSKRKSILGVAMVETFKGESMTLPTNCAAKLQALAKQHKS